MYPQCSILCMWSFLRIRPTLKSDLAMNRHGVTANSSDRQTDRQTERDRQTDRRTGGQTADIQRNIPLYKCKKSNYENLDLLQMMNERTVQFLNITRAPNRFPI